jgi:hypothetical protein
MGNIGVTHNRPRVKGRFGGLWLGMPIGLFLCYNRFVW